MSAEQWNWRDEFEEKTHGGNSVLVVIKEGDWFYGIARDINGYCYMVETSLLRLLRKPKPKKYRPWTMDEVPVGAVVKHKTTGRRRLIIAVDDDYVYHGHATNIFDAMLKDYTMLDGSPCGVEE